MWGLLIAITTIAYVVVGDFYGTYYCLYTACQYLMIKAYWVAVADCNLYI